MPHHMPVFPQGSRQTDGRIFTSRFTVRGLDGGFERLEVSACAPRLLRPEGKPDPSHQRAVDCSAANVAAQQRGAGKLDEFDLHLMGATGAGEVGDAEAIVHEVFRCQTRDLRSNAPMGRLNYLAANLLDC